MNLIYKKKKKKKKNWVQKKPKKKKKKAIDTTNGYNIFTTLKMASNANDE